MIKTPLNLAVATALSISATPSYALVINWLDGPGATNTQAFVVGAGLNTPSAINATPFTTDTTFPTPNATEFRMLDPGGFLGGGGEKSTYIGSGDESWTFADPSGLMTGTGTAFPGNPGTAVVGGSAAPTANTNPTLDRGSVFAGPLFLFLAPTTTSLAGAAYGTASIALGGGNNFSIFFPTLELQWAGTYFPLGLNTGGVTFNCIGANSGNVRCAAEYTFNAAAGDDPNDTGFDGWTAQWNLFGTMTPQATAAIPLPASVWLFGSGILGLSALARRKKLNDKT